MKILNLIILAMLVSVSWSSAAYAKESRQELTVDPVRYVVYKVNETEKKKFDFVGNETELRDWHCEWVDADGIGHDCDYIDVIVKEE